MFLPLRVNSCADLFAPDPPSCIRHAPKCVRTLKIPHSSVAKEKCLSVTPHKMGLESLEPTRSVGKEVRDNHDVLHLTVLLQLIGTCTSYKIQAFFEYQLNLHYVYFLTVHVSYWERDREIGRERVRECVIERHNFE